VPEILRSISEMPDLLISCSAHCVVELPCRFARGNSDGGNRSAALGTSAGLRCAHAALHREQSFSPISPAFPGKAETDAPASQPPCLPLLLQPRSRGCPVSQHLAIPGKLPQKCQLGVQMLEMLAQGCTASGDGLAGMLLECRRSSLASVNQQNQLTFWAGLHWARTGPARDRILIILILKKERNRPHKEILFQSFNSLSYTCPCSEYPDFMRVHSLL